MKYFKLIGLLILVVMVASCSGTGTNSGGDSGGAKTANVSMTIDGSQLGQVVALETEENSMFAFLEDIINFIGPSEAQAVPDDVYRVTVDINGATIAEVHTFDVRGIDVVTLNFTIPTNEDVTFTVTAINDLFNCSDGVVESWTGNATVNVTGDDSITIDMEHLEQPIFSVNVVVSNSNADSITGLDSTNLVCSITADCSGYDGIDCDNPRHLAFDDSVFGLVVPFAGSNNIVGLDEDVADVYEYSVGENPEAVAIRCDSNEIWTVNPGSDSVSVRGGLQPHDITSDGAPCAISGPIAIALANSEAYVANDDGTICVIDAADKSILRTINSGLSAFSPVAIYAEYAEGTPQTLPVPKGPYVFISYSLTGVPDSIIRIDTTNDSILPILSDASQLAVNSTGTKIYAAAGGCEVDIIDVVSGNTTDPIRFDDAGTGACVASSIDAVEVLNDNTRGFAIDSVGGMAYPFNPVNNLPVRDGATQELIAISLGSGAPGAPAPVPVSAASEPAPGACDFL